MQGGLQNHTCLLSSNSVAPFMLEASVLKHCSPYIDLLLHRFNSFRFLIVPRQSEVIVACLVFMSDAKASMQVIAGRDTPIQDKDKRTLHATATATIFWLPESTTSTLNFNS